MNRTFFTSLLAVGLIVTGLVTRQASILALALPVMAYLLAGLWRGPQSLSLEVTRALSTERALSGDQVMVTVSVVNRGKGLDEVLIEDHLPEGLDLVSGELRHLVSLRAGGSFTWSYAIRGRRGYYALDHLRVSARDALGLLPVEEILKTDGELFVLPPTLRLRRVAIRPRRTRVYSGIIPARQGGAGVEFFGVREYQPGDSPRRINWRISARHPQSVFANEFEQERVVDVGIILDGRRPTNVFGEHSIFEHSVLAAASLADAFLGTGNRVGLAFYGRQSLWIMPGYGKLQSERILHSLSGCSEGDSMAFSNLGVPGHVFPAHSQLVLVSPLIPKDVNALAELRARGYHMLVISPNAASFEYERLPKTPEVELAGRIMQMQRQVLLQRVRGLGIQVVDWNVSQPFEQVARRYLERHSPVLRGLQP